MGSYRRIAALVLAAAWMAAPAAQAWAAADRTALDALIARFEAADPNSDSAAYRKLADDTLAEARRLYPDSHPEVAARRLYVAQALASVGDMDTAQAMLDLLAPVLENAPEYRANFRNALSLRSYIANFRGDHAAALRINEALADEYAGDATARGSRDHATTLSNLAASYLEHGRLEDALARNAEAIAMGLALTPVPEDVAIWSANRVAYLYTSGRTEDAVSTAQEAIGRTGGSLGTDHPALANLYANLGAILLRLNRPHDAMAPIRLAYELVEKASGGPTQNSATMRVQFAQALVRAGRHEDALAFLDQAEPVIAAQLGEQSDRVLGARDTRLVALIALNRGAEAEGLARSLLAIRDARLPEGHRDRANIRDNLAKAAFAQGNWAGAAEAGAQAVALREKMLSADHPELLLARAFLLRAEDRGDLRSGEELLAQARSLFAALTFNAQLARGSAQAERLRPAYGWLAELFSRRGAADDAFRAQQWAARESIDDVLALAAAERAAQTDAALAEALSARRKLVAERQGLEARVDANATRPDPAFDLAAVSAELARNRQAIAALDAGLTPAQRSGLLFAPVGLADLRGSAARGDLAVMLTDFGDGWLVTAAGPKQARQALLAQDAPVDALVATLRGVADTGGDAALDRVAAAHLFRVLFPGELGAMVRGARRLHVSANGALAALPFGLLSPDADGRHLLFERASIVRRVGAPRFGGTAGPPPAGAPLIAFGGVSGEPTRAMMALRSTGTASAIAALPTLPDARRELALLGEAIGTGAAQLHVGTAATEESLRKAQVPPGAVLAFATHGLLSDELDGLSEPALLLAPSGPDDGLLKPSEIGAMHLPARLVILSACNTAGASATDRPQLSGLVQGFFLAGARSVLASHWPVRDDVARRLSVGTVRAMGQGMAAGDALRQAIARVRSGSDGEAPLASPALWAMFELFEAG